MTNDTPPLHTRLERAILPYSRRTARMPVALAAKHLVALILATISATTLAAQTTLRGVVSDSLTRTPFAGASVQLVLQNAPWSAGRTTRADSTGAFRIDGVTPGIYIFGFTHPRLDSLGMDAVTRTLTIADGSTIVDASIALPSANTLAREFCGARTDTTGGMIGRVLDAQSGAGRGMARVTARWGELLMQSGVMRPGTAKVSTLAGSDGRYLLCGVPTDVAVFLQVAEEDSTRVSVDSAARDSSGSIEVQFAADIPLLHRDLLLVSSVTPGSNVAAGSEPETIPQPARTARIVGRVLAPDGTPVRGARARVGTAATQSDYAVTDSTGTFRLAGVPAGTQTVQVIAIGFSPYRMAVDLRANVEARVTVQMRQRAYTLDGVKVYASGSRDGDAYAARAKKGGLGYFQTGDEVRSRGQMLVSYAVLRAPGMRVIDTQFGRPVIAGSFKCPPRVFLDGWEIGSDELDRFVSVESLGGIEVYRTPFEVPPQLMRSVRVPRTGGAEPCNVVFVWSKAVVP